MCIEKHAIKTVHQISIRIHKCIEGFIIAIYVMSFFSLLLESIINSTNDYYFTAFMIYPFPLTSIRNRNIVRK